MSDISCLPLVCPLWCLNFNRHLDSLFWGAPKVVSGPCNRLSGIERHCSGGMTVGGITMDSVLPSVRPPLLRPSVPAHPNLGAPQSHFHRGIYIEQTGRERPRAVAAME